MTEIERINLITERLTTALTPTHLEITDNSTQHAGHKSAQHDAGHFTITIVSPKFAGLTLVQRHRLVYNAVNDLLKTIIHALSIRADTPEEFSSTSKRN
jgi:BolA protein